MNVQYRRTGYSCLLPMLAGLAVCAVVWASLSSLNPAASGESTQAFPLPASGHLGRAKLYLAAGDFRRALEACEQEVNERPSAASYTYLTYVYHAIDGYLERQSQREQWGLVEQLYRNLTYREAQDLIDPPGGLARMAKEFIQESVRNQADLTASMATRLDAL
ncbi:MAG TPA: hypothetical protein VLA99_01765 [Nitrospiraceae bacterium]|nr:hypothetical protein [Nitrospiraceae bacterium]